MQPAKSTMVSCPGRFVCCYNHDGQMAIKRTQNYIGKANKQKRFPSVKAIILECKYNGIHHQMCIFVIKNVIFSDGKHIFLLKKMHSEVKFRPWYYKTFLCSIQQSTKFQLLIKTKILTNEEVS